MDSNKKPNSKERTFKTVSRILQEFKKTAKKKKRKKRGNVSEGELKRGQPITRSRRCPAIDLPKEASKKRRMADSEQNFPKGKKGWSHHLFKRISWKKKQKEAIQVLETPKATEGTTFKELAPKNFVRDLRAWSISSSTFGDYPGMYCGFSVVIKEYKETRELGFPFCKNKQDIRCMFCNNWGIILASHFCLVFY